MKADVWLGEAGTQSYTTGSIEEGAGGQQKPLNRHEMRVSHACTDSSRNLESADVFVGSRVDTAKNDILISIQAKLTLNSAA